MIFKPKMHARVNIDIDLSYEEATFIKETFVDTYKLRELSPLWEMYKDGVDLSTIQWAAH